MFLVNCSELREIRLSFIMASLEDHFRTVADVKDLLSVAGLSLRATAVDALLQMTREGLTAEGVLEVLEYMKERKIQAKFTSSR